MLIIVGKQRTGKSYFINQCILEKQEFTVGNSIHACTKGLVLLTRVFKAKNPQHENLSFLVLDTEGLGNPNSQTSSDSKVFLIALLLSSIFLFNSMHCIDEYSFQDLQVMLNLAKDIETKNQTLNQFPQFIWLVRDFALQLENQFHQKIDSKDYLEKSLEESKGVGDAIEQKNKLRRQFKHFFQDRECYVLIRPVEEESQLQHLGVVKNEQLRPEFNQQIAAIRNKIFRKSIYLTQSSPRRSTASA